MQQQLTLSDRHYFCVAGTGVSGSFGLHADIVCYHVNLTSDPDSPTGLFATLDCPLHLDLLPYWCHGLNGMEIVRFALIFICFVSPEFLSLALSSCVFFFQRVGGASCETASH